METPTLFMWVIFDHPLDFPDYFVAHKRAIYPGQDIPTRVFILDPNLEQLRDTMRERGLACLTRSPEDHPKIIETWI